MSVVCDFPQACAHQRGCAVLEINRAKHDGTQQARPSARNAFEKSKRVRRTKLPCSRLQTLVLQ